MKMEKSGIFEGPTQRRSDPTQRRRSMPRRRVAMPQRGREGEKGQFRVRRNKATVHNIEIYVLCLFYFRCSEDSSIGLMRIL